MHLFVECSKVECIKTAAPQSPTCFEVGRRTRLFITILQAAAEGNETAAQKLVVDAAKVAALQGRAAAGDEVAVGLLRASGNPGV